jgi:hypothetical protein
MLLITLLQLLILDLVIRAGTTFSIIGGDNNATGIINSVSTGSGLTLQVNAVGNISGNGFIVKVLTVSAGPTYSITNYPMFGMVVLVTTASELISFSNFDGTS